MKKAVLSITFLAGSLATFAQDKPEPLITRDLLYSILNDGSMVIVIYLIANFIVRIIRYNFDYRLKGKIVEKQTEAGIVSQLVQPEKTNSMRTILQWFCTLLGIGIGFTIMTLTQPLGMHSLAIMAFSVAAGLGTYYYFGKQANS